MTNNAFLRWAAVCGVLVAPGCSNDADDWRTQLQDSDPTVRRQTIRLLAESSVAPIDVNTALVGALDDQEPSVRVAAALALLKVDPQNGSVVPVLEGALREGQGPVFLAVGRAGADSKWAIPTLVGLMTDQRASTRALAAQALGEIGVSDDRVESSLRRGLNDDRPSVRSACQQALDRLGSSAQK